MEDILVVAGARTPFTEYGGSLAEVGATELAAVAARGGDRGGVRGSLIHG